MPAWTAQDLFLRVWRSVLKQPLPLLLALALLPALWAVPVDLVYARWIPEGPAFGSPRSDRAFTLSFAAIVWDAIWGAGAIRIAVDAARGRKVRFRHLLEGIPYTPWIVCTALPILPLELVALLPLEDDPGGASFLFAAVVVITLILLARTVLWAPFLLEAGGSITSGLSASWEATRARTGHILLLACLLALPVLPIAFAEIALSGKAYAATGLVSLFYTLAVGHLYALAKDGAEPSLIQA